MPLNGVKEGTGAQWGIRTERERKMGQSLRQSVERVAQPENLDHSVDEVFRLMLGMECVHEPGAVPRGDESVTAVVGFGGLLSGACVLRSSADDAKKLAAQMTGMEFLTLDDTVKDAIGEICNMVAGAWKGKVPELAANCGLSVPAVITGHDYTLHVQAPEFELHHVYRHGDLHFAVTIVCDGIQ